VWAGIPLPQKSNRLVKPKHGAAESRKPVPRWFEASDRNRDGVISPSEFVGSPEAFQKLDADKNGVISSEEAVR
jgi:Ca2+-binding EF-hand superfamily protein